jgi:DNA-binding PadR family transcriptional regulator
MSDGREPGVGLEGALAERREVAEYALLGLLRDGPRHGYRLAEAFEPQSRLGIVLRLKMGQMYAYLRKLERQGLLKAHHELNHDSHHTRRVFALTDAGARAFDAWLAAPVEATREMRLAFMVKLAFTLSDAQAALALIERQRAATSAWLTRQRSRAEERAEDGGALTLTHLTLRHRILLSEATLAWLDETAAQLRAALAHEEA